MFAFSYVENLCPAFHSNGLSHFKTDLFSAEVVMVNKIISIKVKKYFVNTERLAYLS